MLGHRVLGDRALNPVLARELRERMRTPRSAVILTLYLAILSLIVWAIYTGVSRSSELDVVDANAVSTAGRSIFHWLLICVLLLVCFIVPGQTSGAIAGERERQTLGPLQVTLLRPWSIVAGKLLSSLAFTVLLLVATLPLLGVSFIVGGVSGREVVAGVAMVLAVAICLACVALAWSSLVRRAQAANVLAYFTVLTLLIGTFIGYFVQQEVTRSDTSEAPQGLLVVNPIMATADAVRGRSGAAEVETPITLFQDMLWDREGQGDTTLFVPNRDFTGRELAQFADTGTDRGVPFWVWSVLAYTAISAGSLLVATRMLRAPAPRLT